MLCTNRLYAAKPMFNLVKLKPRPNEQALFGEHLKFCLSSKMLVGLTITQTCAWQIFLLLVTSKKVVEKFQKHLQANCAYPLQYVCRRGQEHRHA